MAQVDRVHVLSQLSGAMAHQRVVAELVWAMNADCFKLCGLPVEVNEAIRRFVGPYLGRDSGYLLDFLILKISGWKSSDMIISKVSVGSGFQLSRITFHYFHICILTTCSEADSLSPVP